MPTRRVWALAALTCIGLILTFSLVFGLRRSGSPKDLGAPNRASGIPRLGIVNVTTGGPSRLSDELTIIYGRRVSTILTTLKPSTNVTQWYIVRIVPEFA